MKYIVGIAVGFLIALLLAFDPEKNPYEVDSLPPSTVYIVIALGAFGGIAGGGLYLLRGPARASGIALKRLDNFIDFYSLVTACTLSMGIQVFARVGLSNIFAAVLLKGYFFSSVALGLILAGLGKLWQQHRIDSK
jgi:hypothetical protein